LVGLATTTPAARQTITLDPQNQNSSTPAVVLERFQRTLNRLGDSQFRIGFPDDGRSGAARII
jgi:hypothetical protein